MKPFAIRAQQASVSLIKQISAEAHKDHTIINLSQGIPSFSTPAYIREKIAKALTDDEPGIGKYSVYMGQADLREAIARQLTSEWKKQVDGENELFVSAGAMEGLMAIAMALIDPGDEVIIPSPDYGPHFQHLHLTGAKQVLVPLDEKNGWAWDIDAVEKAITPKTKLLILTNPGNPCGNVYTKADLERIASIAKAHDLWVLVDETYYYLTYDNTPFTPAATIDDFDGRLVVVRSFSKEYAMTGWRLGFIYAPAPLIKEALKMHDPMVIAASTVSQRAGLIALKNRDKTIDTMVNEFSARKDAISTALEGLAPHFSFIRPKGAYYVFVKVHPDTLKKFGPTTIDFAHRMIKEAKVAVVPGVEFKSPTDEFIRFSFGNDIATIEEGITRIKKWLNS